MGVMAKGTENLVNLAKEALHSEDAAVELMIRLRWPSGPACPMCGGADPYRLKPKAQPGRPARRGLFKCSQCKKQFSVTTGSVFEASHLPLSKWLMAIHLMSASKKGMSAHQLHRMLGITYRAAWFAFHRLRYAMSTNADLFAKLSGTVEVDETYIGGKRRAGGRNRSGKAFIGRPQPNDKTKVPVVALVERKGRAVAFPVERVDGRTLQEAIRSRVHLNAHMMSDELHSYDGLSMGFAAHDTIKHSDGVYAKGNIHTNTVEGFFALLKRGIVGSFHHVSKAHLHRYCDEFAFRYSTRAKLGYTDGDRAAQLVLGAEGKRLTYKTGSGTRAA
jgi:transposase-like protein